jgi:hypothetical protein
MLGAVVIAVVVLIYCFTTTPIVAECFLAGEAPKNILGGRLQPCSTAPGKTTGVYRNGLCATGPNDPGAHTVCAVVDDRFLDFTKSRGNDLSAARPPSFPGLTAGDKWCLCARRWIEAHDAGKAPRIIAESTNEAALRHTSKDVLMRYR